MGLCALRFWYIPPDGQSCYSPESCVYDHVFSDYNTRVRPATDPEEVIQINASVTATSLTGIVSNATRAHCNTCRLVQALAACCCGALARCVVGNSGSRRDAPTFIHTSMRRLKSTNTGRWWHNTSPLLSTRAQPTDTVTTLFTFVSIDDLKFAHLDHRWFHF